MIPPLVSVIIPAYNRAATIARSIDSVLAQGYRPIEVIVVDDGSTDQTVEVIRGYGEQVTLIRQSNGGPSSARNTGATQAKGEIIAFLDSDDTWKTQKLERQIDLMVRAGSKVPCCICNATLISEDGTSRNSFEVSGVDCELPEGYWLNPAPIIATRFVLFNQVVSIRREAFESVGGFNESMRLLEDHDLAFRLSLLGPWAFISEPLVEKYNDSEGVGVLAMRDPTVHVNAWCNALKGFLKESLLPGGEVERNIRRNLTDVGIELQAVELISKSSAFARMTGRMLLFSLRIKGAIRRRLPSWPEVRAVASLAPDTGSPASHALVL
jgi:glycosyltransferase involved in cell wall biosynthesis